MYLETSAFRSIVIPFIVSFTVHVIVYGGIAIKKLIIKKKHQVQKPKLVKQPTFNNVKKNENVLSSTVAFIGAMILFTVAFPFILSTNGAMKFDFALKSFAVAMFHIFASVIKPLAFLIVKPNIARNIRDLWLH